MSRKTLLSRPRTRLYDANYNIGESYYRPALDRLDRKYSGRPLSPPRHQNTPLGDIAERHARIFADEDLATSRKRAEKHIREDHLFDSRGGRIAQRSILDNFENGINDETSASIQRIRANKKVSVIDDVDLENTSNNLKSYRLLDRSEKILDSVGISDNTRRGIIDDGSTYKRRGVKAVTFDTDGDDLSLKKWTPIENQVSSVKARHEEVTSIRARREDNSASIRSDSSAAIRARQSKEKINDIEEEMAAIAEKQAAREARVARLRALVAETEQDSEAFEVSQAAAERKSARREKYQS